MISKEWLQAIHEAAHAVVALRLGVYVERIEGHSLSHTENQLKAFYPKSMLVKMQFEDVLYKGKDGADSLMTVLCSTEAIGSVLDIEGMDMKGDLLSIQKLKETCDKLNIELDPIELYVAKAKSLLTKPVNTILVHVIAERIMAKNSLWLQNELMLMMDYPGIYARRQMLFNGTFENDSFDWQIQTAGYQVMSAYFGLEYYKAVETLATMVSVGDSEEWSHVYSALDNRALDELLLVYFAGREVFHVLGIETAKTDEYISGAQVILDRAKALGRNCNVIDVYRQRCQELLNDRKNSFVLHLLLGYFVMNPELFQKDEDGVMLLPDMGMAWYFWRSVRLDAEEDSRSENLGMTNC